VKYIAEKTHCQRFICLFTLLQKVIGLFRIKWSYQLSKNFAAT